MINKAVSVIGSQMDMGAVRKGVDMGPLAAELILTCLGKTDYRLFGI